MIIIILIKTINGGEVGEYEKDFMKIKFISDDNLPINKIFGYASYVNNMLATYIHMLDLFFKKTTNVIHKIS